MINKGIALSIGFSEFADEIDVQNFYGYLFNAGFELINNNFFVNSKITTVETIMLIINAPSKLNWKISGMISSIYMMRIEETTNLQRCIAKGFEL